jgi:hypothetical protein
MLSKEKRNGLRSYFRTMQQHGDKSAAWNKALSLLDHADEADALLAARDADIARLRTGLNAIATWLLTQGFCRDNEMQEIARAALNTEANDG